MLRNRAYLGEIAFRGVRQPAAHPPLIDPALFERAEVILQERGEDASLRRSNQSDYLLTGLIRCARCGKRYIGAAAHGNGGRYAYYVCFTRQRYGTPHCDADRLPARPLEDAILAQLERVLSQDELVREAIAEAFAEQDAERPKREAELKAIDAELRQADRALERYFHAFEAGTMPERACAPRIAELSERLEALAARRQELAIDEPEQAEPLTDDDLRALQAHVRDVIETGDPPARKALLQALVAEIRVVSRQVIYPTFNLPAVRPPVGSVGDTGLEPVTSAMSRRAEPDSEGQLRLW
jgi:site-specific DNA recombinase